MPSGQPARNCSMNDIFFAWQRKRCFTTPELKHHFTWLVKASCCFIEIILLKTHIVVAPLESGLLTVALSKVCKRAKIMFLGVNFQKRSAIPQVTPAFFPICCDSRCDFTSPLPSIILSNLSLVPDKVFMCITWKPSLDLANE